MGEGGEGLVAHAELFQREALIGPGGVGVLVALHRFVEVFQRRLVVPGREIGEAASLEGFGIAGRERDRLGEIVDRLRVLALRLVDQPAIVEGTRIVGVERDRLVEIGERLVDAIVLAIDVAAADIGDRVARLISIALL